MVQPQGTAVAERISEVATTRSAARRGAAAAAGGGARDDAKTATADEKKNKKTTATATAVEAVGGDEEKGKAAAAAPAAAPSTPAPEPHSSDDDSFFGSSDDEGEEEIRFEGGGALDDDAVDKGTEKSKKKEKGESAPGLTSAQLARRRLRAVRRLHAAYSRQSRVLMSALEERTRKALEEKEEDGDDGAGGKSEKEGNNRRRRERRTNRPEGFPDSMRPDPLLADGETPCADPGTVSDAETEKEKEKEKGKGKEGEDAKKSKPSSSSPKSNRSKRGPTSSTAARKRKASGEEGEEEQGEDGDDGRQGKAAVAVPLSPLPPPRKWRSALRSGLPSIARLESLARSSSSRELDESGALAALCGKKCRFLIRSTAVALGRAPTLPTPSEGEEQRYTSTLAAAVVPSTSTRLLRALDADLSSEGDARKVSRQQAWVELGATGKWTLTAVGRRAVVVDGARLSKGSSCELRSHAMVEAGGIRLMFVPNERAVRRAMARSSALGL